MKAVKVTSVFACAIALCFALVACGGSAPSSSASASSSASSSAAAESSSASSSAAADPAEKFVGDRQLAAVESQGITMTGNFATMFGSDEPTTLSLKADGTGTMVFAGDEAAITWEVSGDDTFTLTADYGDVNGAYEDGVVSIEMADGEFTGTMFFTEDGTMEGVKEISLSSAKDITSEDALVGSWSLSGMNMSGVSMYGDAAALAEAAGETDVTVTFDKGGTATLMGEDATWAAGGSGATVTLSGVDIPVKMIGDDIVIDVLGALGDLGLGDTDIVFVFSK